MVCGLPFPSLLGCCHHFCDALPLQKTGVTEFRAKAHRKVRGRMRRRQRRERKKGNSKRVEGGLGKAEEDLE